jgi:hypothetical protein
VTRATALALLLLLAGCGSETALWLRVEAPLVVPTACDSIDVDVARADGTAAFGQSYDLTQGPQFPLTLSLVAQTNADVSVPLTVTVAALKAGALVKPWATKSAQVTLSGGQLTPLTIQLCECP